MIWRVNCNRILDCFSPFWQERKCNSITIFESLFYVKSPCAQKDLIYSLNPLLSFQSVFFFGRAERRWKARAGKPISQRQNIFFIKKKRKEKWNRRNTQYLNTQHQHTICIKLMVNVKKHSHILQQQYLVRCKILGIIVHYIKIL